MTDQTFNRRYRKVMAAKAKVLAVKLAGTAIDYDRAGRLVKVTDARARAVLRQAYERMLRAGGEPQLLQLAHDTAAAFPRGGQAPDDRASAWLAVGVDRAGMATYTLRWLDVSGLDPVTRRTAAEAALFTELAAECGIAGFPVAGHA